MFYYRMSFVSLDEDAADGGGDNLSRCCCYVSDDLNGDDSLFLHQEKSLVFGFHFVFEAQKKTQNKKIDTWDCWSANSNGQDQKTYKKEIGGEQAPKYKERKKQQQNKLSSLIKFIARIAAKKEKGSLAISKKK